MRINIHNNIDDREIAKFEALAAQWWDPAGLCKPLHDINPIRLEYIQRCSGSLLGKKVLDVGCGGGILAESMAISGANVTGIDISEMPIAAAKLHQLESGTDHLIYHLTTVEDLCEKESSSFDIVTCMEMLEHVPHPEVTVIACAKLLKPGGHLFLSTINRTLKAYLIAIISAEYILGMLPRGTHEYHKFIKPSEVSYWIRDAGLSLVSITGLKYNPIFGICCLVPNLDINYLIHSQLL